MTEHLARLKKAGETFEIVIDPDKAMEFRRNGGNVEEALVFPKVFTDAKKGFEASPELLEGALGTQDHLEAAAIILKEGEIQLSAEYRQKMREQKRKKIIDWIHMHSIDPRQNTPHPVSRIENALDEAKVRIDEYKTADEQVEQIVEKLKVVMPIKIATKVLSVTIPAQHAGKCHGVLHSMGKILKESWDNSGNWTGRIEIPGGLELEFYDKINKATNGQNEIEVIE